MHVRARQEARMQIDIGTAGGKCILKQWAGSAHGKQN